MRRMLVILTVAGSLIAGSNAVANAEPITPVPPLCQVFGPPLALVKWIIDPYSQSPHPMAVALRGVEQALCRP
ncbi:hypothetical protein ACWDYH_07715 [Nocardia goodfellowii]